MGVKCGEDIDRHEAEKLYAELKFKTEYNRILRAESERKKIRGDTY